MPKLAKEFRKFTEGLAKQVVTYVNKKTGKTTSYQRTVKPNRAIPIEKTPTKPIPQRLKQSPEAIRQTRNVVAQINNRLEQYGKHAGYYLKTKRYYNAQGEAVTQTTAVQQGHLGYYNIMLNMLDTVVRFGVTDTKYGGFNAGVDTYMIPNRTILTTTGDYAQIKMSEDVLTLLAPFIDQLKEITTKVGTFGETYTQARQNLKDANQERIQQLKNMLGETEDIDERKSIIDEIEQLSKMRFSRNEVLAEVARVDFGSQALLRALEMLANSDEETEDDADPKLQEILNKFRKPSKGGTRSGRVDESTWNELINYIAQMSGYDEFQEHATDEELKNLADEYGF